MTNCAASTFIMYVLLVAIMGMIVALSFVLEDRSVSLLLSEGGLVETASAIGYFLCIALLLYVGRTASLKSHWYIHVIFLAIALRELDFDKRFTATGVLKSKFIMADDVWLIGKIVGLTIVLIVLLAVLTWSRCFC